MREILESWNIYPPDEMKNSPNSKNVSINESVLPLRFQRALNHYQGIILSRDMPKNVFLAPNAQIW